MEGPRFRAGVVIAVRDSAGRLMAFERCDAPGAWQLPQGGIDSGETPEQAAWRELAEETGLGPGEVALDGPLGDWTVYELPEEYRRGELWGQAHRWFGFRVLTTDVHPVCDGVEFSSWKWMTADELVDGVVEFRRRSYDEVLRGR